MGLFSKKTIVCERCGKEYQARIAIGRHLCSECIDIEITKENNVKGYLEYASMIFRTPYSYDQLDEIAAHREAILNKYKMNDGITRQELQNASDNYKKLTDEQAADILRRAGNSSATASIGAAYTGYFFLPTKFEKTIVDTQDIFAVGYTNEYKLDTLSYEVILCAIFTNDPYIPVFPMLYLGKLGMFELMKSKKGRKGVETLFTMLCPNLTYPVMDLGKLKKQIKSEKIVKGNIDMKEMLDLISLADSNSSIFDPKNFANRLTPDTADMIESFGYIEQEEIDSILKLDKMFNRKYWQKQIKRLTDYDIGDK